MTDIKIETPECADIAVEIIKMMIDDLNISAHYLALTNEWHFVCSFFNKSMVVKLPHCEVDDAHNWKLSVAIKLYDDIKKNMRA